jgi:hypothetical protein
MEVDEVEVEIEDLASFDESKNILLFGPSGVGKTVLAGGAPNATFFSTEKGVVAAKRAGHKAGLIRVPTWEHCVAGLKVADDRLGPEDWMVVDSLPKMQMLYIRWILRMNNIKNGSRDLDIPAIQDHQKWQNGFMRFVDHIVDAQYNSILIATQMMSEDEEGEERVLPAIQGKKGAIAEYVCAQTDVNLYYSVSAEASSKGKRVRRALAQPEPPFHAKDRFNCLGDYVDVVDGDYGAMRGIIERIQGSLDERPDGDEVRQVHSAQLHRRPRRRPKTPA